MRIYIPIYQNFYISRVFSSCVRVCIGLLFCLLAPFQLSAQVAPTATSTDTWVETQIQSMSLDEKLGQMFMVRAHSDGSHGSLAKLKQAVSQYHVGGFCFFSGTPKKQIEWINELQTTATKTPLLMAMDAEWGLAMRFADEAPSFPYAMTLGAGNDLNLIRKIGRETGRQLSKVGIQMSFSPVADLNTNPDNPVIGKRSFGENPLKVGRAATAYARGLADSRILAVAKHFPGHGETELDSHEDLPRLKLSKSRLSSKEMVPFQMLAQEPIAGIMLGHLEIPALDDRKNRPASLSKAITEDLLREKWFFDGLIISDGLDMKAVTKHFSPEEIAVEAVIAGNDILLLHPNVGRGLAALKKAIAKGEISEKRIEQSVRRILKAKYKTGLHQRTRLFTGSLRSQIFTPRVDDINQEAYRKAITIVKNSEINLPIIDLQSKRIAALSIGTPYVSDFQNIASRYAPVSRLNISKPLSIVEQKRWIDQLASYDLVLVGIHDMSWKESEDFGLLRSQLNVLRSVSSKTKVIVVLFGSPYAMNLMQDFQNLMVAYENHPFAQRAAAEIIFGGVTCQGSLPVSVNKRIKAGTTKPTSYAFRLKYSTPGNAGLVESKLSEIDRLAQEAISKKATPGGVVLVAKDGKIAYIKSYGKQTYDQNSLSVYDDTIYDLASVTKVASATLCIMKLHEEGQISVFDPLEKHLPETQGTNKGQLIIQDILAHRARLKPWIPFYERTMDRESKSRYIANAYSKVAKPGFNTKVSKDLYIADRYQDTIYQLILDSDLRDRSGYRYSDLGFYLMAKLVKTKTGLSIAEYADRKFYKPLGMRTMGYNPLEKFDKERIPPTENDNYFRHHVVQGYVHDMGAAMLGGISGHAGLFSDVVDLATLFQMFLNEGYYGGQRYLKPETIRLFTRRHPKSTRRGLGFDMAELSTRGSTNMTPLASSKTFGHLGFTGTCTWADPETGLLFIWLTNRTYPKMSPNTFGKENFRPRMQEAAYNSIMR